MTETTPKAPKKVKIKLLDDNHTHRGEPCRKDDIIEVREDQARRLIEAKRATAA